MLGSRVPRTEDPALLTGRAQFLDDLAVPAVLHVAFLRSEHSHARVRRIDTSRALSRPGVVAAFTGEDLGEVWRPVPLVFPTPAIPGLELNVRTQLPLAREKARYAGEPLAAVVAEDRYAAEDALESVAVELQALEPAVEPEAALERGAPLVHEDLGTNLAARGVQETGDYAAARAAADLVIARRLAYDRGAGAAMENRGVLARWDAERGLLTVWDTTQAPVLTREGLAEILGLPESRVRVVAPSIGGGFGPKFAMFYPEEVVVPWIALRLGRPVKWVEDRRENFLATTQERKQIHDAEIALTREGEILGLRDVFLQDTGAYNPYGATLPLNTQWAVPGPYRVPAYSSEFRSVFTNRTPVTPVRGAGQPHAVFVMERLLDLAARELGMDRLEIRRRSLLTPDAFPCERGLRYHDGTPVVYDSGDYRRALERAAEAIGYEGFSRGGAPAAGLDREARARLGDGGALARARDGRRLGVGVACYVEGTGYGPAEGVRVSVEETGEVTVATGIGSQGQGHETSLAQVAAESLGLGVESVRVAMGDTGTFGEGVGTFASRSAVVAANACREAAEEVCRRLLEAAAEALEVAAEDLELVEGAVRPRGAPQVSVTLGELARRARGRRARGRRLRGRRAGPEAETGLEATASFAPPHPTTPYGVHAMIVAVDPDTAEVEILRYVVVHDCGRVIHPTIVEGQIQGGVALGIGNAFYEELACDEEGRLLNGSLAGYLVPRATEVPEIEVLRLETPSPFNPLGTKGMGEGGAIPVAAAFAQAVEDALAAPGLEILEIPLSPGRLFRLLRDL